MSIPDTINIIQEEIGHLDLMRTVRCSKPWTTLDERSVSGDFKVCCFLKRYIGHIGKQSDNDFIDLWNSQNILDLRKAMKESQIKSWCPSGCPVLNQRADYFQSLEFWNYDIKEYSTFPQIFRENREKTINTIIEQKTKMGTFPIRLKLYTSEFCNIDCKMCDLEKTKKTVVGDNYLQNAYKLMPYLEDLTVFGGEPFACPTSRKLIFGEEIKKYPHIHLSTITNGTLLDEKTLDKLKGLRLGCFTFSLDSFNEITYNYIRRRANYSNLMKNLKRFINCARTGEINIKMIQVSCTIQEANFNEISSFIECAHSLNIKPVFGIVGKSKELLGKINELKRCIEDGLSTAERLGCSEAFNELTRIWDDLPLYRVRESKEFILNPIRDIVGRRRVTSFFNRHNYIKQFIKKIMHA